MKTMKKAQVGVVVPKKNEKEEFTYLRKSEKTASKKVLATKPTKKAKSGTSLGMKSVKSGYDNNSGVTRADFVSIGKGTAKSGTKMKMGGSIKKAQYGREMSTAGEVVKGMQNISSQQTAKPKTPKTPVNPLPPEEAKRRYIRPADKSPEMFPTNGVAAKDLIKNGKTIKKAGMHMMGGKMMKNSKMKMGGVVKKAQTGTVQSANQQTQSNVNKIAMKNAGDSMQKSAAGAAKNGKSMKKCKYGCK